MASIYSILKPVYRQVLPSQVRAVLLRKDLPFYRPFIFLRGLLERRAANDEVYDKAYFESLIDGAAQLSAPVIVETLVREFSPSSIVDVGCGTGAIIQQFLARGVRCLGLENAEAALEILRKRGLNVRKVDLEEQLPSDIHADLVVSTEVAEHLPERFADSFVDLLCSISSNVAMTAAQPGQGGTDHVNEQPHAYWITKLKQRNYRFEEALSMSLRREWESRGVVGFYWQNLMIFRREDSSVPKAVDSPSPL